MHEMQPTLDPNRPLDETKCATAHLDEPIDDGYIKHAGEFHPLSAWAVVTSRPREPAKTMDCPYCLAV